MSDRTISTIQAGDRWDDDDEAGQRPFKALTRQEAQALRAKEPPG